VKLFCIGLLLASFNNAADLVEHPSKRVWIRRITMGAACAASLGFDTFTTRRAVSAGAVETNGLLANAQGRPAWGRIIGIKAGLCAASAYVQEQSKSTPRNDWTFTAVNLGVTAGYTWVGFHNLHLAQDLSK
jgi:hypothetical protein